MDNYKEFWQNIIQKIEDLKKLDPKCKIIASAKHYHQYQRLPVVSANTIITFEKENKVNLPESYRTYLQYYGAGGAGPADCISSFFSDALRSNIVTASTYPSHVEAIKNCYFLSEDEEHPINKLHGLLSLGHSGLGNNYLVINGKEHGLVWYWDNDYTLCNNGPFDQWYSEWVDKALLYVKSYHNYNKISQNMKFSEIKAIMETKYKINNLEDKLSFHILTFEHLPDASIKILPDYDINKENFTIIDIHEPRGGGL